jgi:hypothetical protein
MEKRLFSDDHPSVVTSLNILGAFYYSQGRYSEAEQFKNEALALIKNVNI